MDYKRLANLQNMTPAELLEAMRENKTSKMKSLVTHNDYEAFFSQLWLKLFKDQSFDIKTNFFELGGTSLQCVMMLSQIKEQYNLELDLIELFKATTIEAQAQLVESLINKKNVEIISYDYQQDINKIDELVINKNTPQYSGALDKIFLTGATGFLGIHLLKELMKKSKADIYCLIRADNEEQGIERLLACAKQYAISFNKNEIKRMRCFTGNLEQEKLGLSEKDYNFLVEQIDLIIHSAAKVNFLYPYEALRAANILSLYEIIKVAATSKIKPLHFVSSIGVFSDITAEDKNRIDENTELPEQCVLNGYFQSKLIGEKMCRKAREKGIPVSVYRPSGISMNSKTKITSEEDLTFLFGKLIKKIGCYYDMQLVDIVPVDYVAESIAQLISDSPGASSDYHLTSAQQIQLVSIMDRLPNRNLFEQVSPMEFIKRCINYIDSSDDNRLKNIKPLLLGNRNEILSYPVYSDELTRLLLKTIKKTSIEELFLMIYSETVDYRTGEKRT